MIYFIAASLGVHDRTGPTWTIPGRDGKQDFLLVHLSGGGLAKYFLKERYNSLNFEFDDREATCMFKHPSSLNTCILVLFS